MESRLPFNLHRVARHALPKFDAGERKTYRRKGYRVRIEGWHSDQLRWSVYRPRMKTSAATTVTPRGSGPIAAPPALRFIDTPSNRGTCSAIPM